VRTSKLPIGEQSGLMATFTGKIAVSNSTKRPRIVWVEPWGEDYTLLPGEELELLCRDDTEQPWFHVVEWEDGSQIYVEQGGYFEVLQQGKRIECGHNRQAGQEAGLSY
jgi:hypothetical protein